MGEMASALRIIGGVKTASLLKYPSGRWGFAGCVDSRLLYKMLDGSDVPEDLMQKISSYGPGLFKNQVKGCSWDSKEQAQQAADAIGQAYN